MSVRAQPAVKSRGNSFLSDDRVSVMQSELYIYRDLDGYDMYYQYGLPERKSNRICYREMAFVEGRDVCGGDDDVDKGALREISGLYWYCAKGNPAIELEPGDLPNELSESAASES